MIVHVVVRLVWGTVDKIKVFARRSDARVCNDLWTKDYNTAMWQCDVGYREGKMPVRIKRGDDLYVVFGDGDEFLFPLSFVSDPCEEDILEVLKYVPA